MDNDKDAKPAQVAPVKAIVKLLDEAMDRAVRNGANSVSMPDEYVEIAAWLAAAPPAQPFRWPFDTSRGMSWNGFNICGDAASIAEVQRLAHWAPQWKAMLDATALKTTKP